MILKLLKSPLISTHSMQKFRYNTDINEFSISVYSSILLSHDVVSNYSICSSLCEDACRNFTQCMVKIKLLL